MFSPEEIKRKSNKYRNRHSKIDPVDIREFLGTDASKIANKIKKYEENSKFWKMAPGALLVAFVIVTIMILISQGH